MNYAVAIEKEGDSFGAYVPDLPGCVAVGGSHKEAMQLIQEAIEFHLDGMREAGEPIPAPQSSVEYVAVPA